MPNTNTAAPAALTMPEDFIKIAQRHARLPPDDADSVMLYPNVSAADERLLLALVDQMPPRWCVGVEPADGLAWVAYVRHEDAPLAWPTFLVCRWEHGYGFGARWMDGSTFSSGAFRDLKTALDLIPSGIFAGAEASLATVRADGWAATRH